MNQIKTRFKKVLLLLFTIAIPAFVFAQSKTVSISGKAIDNSTQSVIAGASVIVKGSSTGVVTNEKGEFNLSCNLGDKLEISFIGYDKVTETVKEGVTSYNFKLKSNSSQLTDVVVTALGIKKDKKIIGYSTQEVSAKDLTKAREPNAMNGLVGKVAGLNVGTSAELLGSPNIQLRGGVINLYVVDGVPITSDTWNINSDDIETYTVLKGPVASALYGYRGQNGAIVITTKKGTKSDKGVTVEYNNSTQYNNGFIALPRTQDLYGPGDHGKYSFVDGKGGGTNDNDYDVWGPKFEGQLIKQYDSPIDPITGERTATPWVARGKDNLKRFIQTGVLTSNNLAVSSSGDKYDLRVSYGQTYQKGIIPNTDLNTNSFNMTSTLKFNKRLTLDATLNYNRQYTKNIPDVNYGPNSVIYNITIWGGADWNIDDMKDYWQEGKEGVQSIYAEYQRYHNPYFMSYEWLRGHQKNDIYGYTSLNYKANDFIDLMFRTSISTYDIMRNEKMPFSAHPYGREEGKGDYREDKRSLFENNSEFIAKFKTNKLLNFIDVNGFVGGNIRSFSYNSSFATTDYLNVPNVYSFANSRNPVKVYNFKSDMAVQSYFSSVDFSLGKFANINATGRVDKSSALFAANNTFFYPSVNATTVLNNYIDLPSAINLLKLRASYAQVRGSGNFVSNTIGSTPGNSYPIGYGAQYSSVYGGPSYNNSSVYNVTPGYNNTSEARYTSSLIDGEIKPDNRVSQEVGVEAKLFGNKVNFDMAYFNYIDGLQIFSKEISQASGYSNYTLNATKTQKTGFEVTVGATPFKSKSGLTWQTMLNWSTFKETFTELPAGVQNLNTFFKVGSRTDEVYIKKFARTADGKIINDAGGRPIVMPVAQYAGNSNPDFILGFINKVDYKNVTLGFQFDGCFGGVMEDYVRKKTMQGGRHIETTEGALGDARYQDYLGIKSYIGEGVQVANGAAIQFDPVTGQITNYGDLTFANNSTATYAQDYTSRLNSIPEANMMSKTYLKLREVTLTYQLPAKFLKKSFIESASVSLVARNVLYFMKDKKFNDVDIDQFNNSQSGSSLQTPTTRSYGFNVNLTF